MKPRGDAARTVGIWGRDASDRRPNQVVVVLGAQTSKYQKMRAGMLMRTLSTNRYPWRTYSTI